MLRDHRTRVLVTYGTRNGGTAGIASLIASTLAEAGLVSEVRPASWVTDLTSYDAVVLGGAVYAGRWHRDARDFAHRFALPLQAMPVWVFSSGPLDGSAEEQEIPPVPQAAAIVAEMHARGHVTFGGRLDEFAEGIVARMMLHSGRKGDWRDDDHIRRWSREIAAQLSSSTAAH
jgi:menaquinone-dependent protoporphyrinogen oxidase